MLQGWVAHDFAMWGIARHHAIASRHPLFPVDRFGGRVVTHGSPVASPLHAEHQRAGERNSAGEMRAARQHQQRWHHRGETELRARR